jgi:predicted dehydrogenase
MNRPCLRGAVIGCGYVSQFHLEAWSNVPGAEIVSLCDPDPARLEAAGRLRPEATRFRSATALFEAGPLDFIEICTRHDSHPELVALAAKHGTHVLCQKPAALDRDAFLTMLAVSEAAGTRLMIHENWRFRPWYRALRAEILAGTIGPPIRLRIAHRETRALRPDGFAAQPYFAGMKRLILFEMGPHLVDTARFLMGEVRSVTAVVGRFGEGHIGDDLATLMLTFASGSLGLLDMTWCAPAETARPEWAINESVVEGTDGTLRLQPDGSLLLVKPDGQTERRNVSLPPDAEIYVQGYLATQTHFIKGLIDGSDHETSGLDNLKTMDVIWAGYRSAEEGRSLVP